MKLFREFGKSREQVYWSNHYTEHKIYPRQLRELNIERSNQVWAPNLPNIPRRRVFIYVVAIMGCHSHKGSAPSVVQRRRVRFLRRGPAGGHQVIHKSEDLQYRSWRTVHKRGLHEDTDRHWHRHQDERPETRAGQDIHRAPVEDRGIT